MEGFLRTLGIDIGGTSVKMGILDPIAGLGAIRQIDVTPDAPELVADNIARLAREFEYDIAGVGTAGAVNHKTWLVSAVNLAWKNVPLRAMLEKRLGKPVWVDNDAQSALMAEWHSGACKDARCAVLVTLGTGIGGALLIDGRPWRGENNTAFELGHIITHAEEYATDGSKKGRFEYYASSLGISRMAGGRPAREVLDGVVAGETYALAVFDKFMHELAIGLLSVITLFNPEVIVLGGGISAVGAYFLEGIRRKLAELQADRASAYEGERIQLAFHRNNAGVIGAATLANLYLREGKK